MKDELKKSLWTQPLLTKHNPLLTLTGKSGEKDFISEKDPNEKDPAIDKDPNEKTIEGLR